MTLAQFIDLPDHGDARGGLVAIEGERTVPFPIRRVYYLHGLLPDRHRGFHAHYQLRQLLVCVAGSCTVLLDDGRSRERVSLASPTRGLFVGTMLWHEMCDFTTDCVLLVLASEPFSEDDYVRNYDAFLAAVGSGT